MQRIAPWLWFDGRAEEAANFYTSIFANSRIVRTTRFGDAGPGPKGSVMAVEFELEGMRFGGLNGGPEYQFTPAVSFSVSCANQGEVDELWSKLSAGGEPGRCGWLKDKFGVSWQIVPTRLIELLGEKDPQRSRRVMEALLKMDKIDIAKLEAAAKA